MYLLCITEGFRLHLGDGLVFGCAFVYAVQLLLIDYYAVRTDPLRLAAWQFLLAGLMSGVCMLIFEDFVWEREAADFIDTLRKAGLETFVVTNDSTALMENIHWFVGLGCKLEGTCIVTRHRRRWGEDEKEQLMGLRFSL